MNSNTCWSSLCSGLFIASIECDSLFTIHQVSCILKNIPINDIIATKVYQYFYLISTGGFKLKNKYKLTGRSGESIRLLLQFK